MVNRRIQKQAPPVEKVATKPNSKYDNDIHPAMLLKVMEGGGGVHDFIAEAEIGFRTFYSWKLLHPDFEEAYDRGRCLGYRRHEQTLIMGIHDPSFNFTAWNHLSRHRYRAAYSPNLMMLRGKSPHEKQQLIFEAAARGDLDAKELQILTSVIHTAADTYEKTVLADKVNKLAEQLDIQD